MYVLFMNFGARLRVQVPALVLHSTMTSPSLSFLMCGMGVILPTSVRKSLRIAGSGVITQHGPFGPSRCGRPDTWQGKQAVYPPGPWIHEKESYQSTDSSKAWWVMWWRKDKELKNLEWEVQHRLGLWETSRRGGGVEELIGSREWNRGKQGEPWGVVCYDHFSNIHSAPQPCALSGIPLIPSSRYNSAPCHHNWMRELRLKPKNIWYSGHSKLRMIQLEQK